MGGRGFGSAARIAAALAAGVLWTGCRTAPAGPDPSEPGADPSAHASYGFASPLGTENESPELSERLRLAVSHELEDRGYLYDADGPAMRVDLHVLPAPPPPEVRDPGIQVGRDFFDNPVYVDAQGRRIPRRVAEPESPSRALLIRIFEADGGRLLWQRTSATWPDAGAAVDEATLLATVAGVLEGLPRSSTAP